MPSTRDWPKGESSAVATAFTITAPQGLTVSSASTIICLRRNDKVGPQRCTTAQFPVRYQEGFLEGRDSILFECGWEVLMGQAEVKNWITSTQEKSRVMRYPGEYRFAGGTVDEGESVLETGRRELAEEFLNPAGDFAV